MGIRTTVLFLVSALSVPTVVHASAAGRPTEVRFPVKSAVHSEVAVLSPAEKKLSLPLPIEPLKRVAILVPGTLNSLMPGSISLGDFPNLHQRNPYFSETVVAAFESQGYATYVVQGLEWCGQLERNGDLTLAEIRRWYSEHYPKGDARITIVAHSAGGFYALQALTQAPDLPVDQLYLLSTPLEGLKLANDIMNSPVVGDIVQKVVDQAAGLFDLRGLTAMTTAKTHEFLAHVRIPEHVRVYAIGGSQPVNWNPFELFNPDYLSPIFFASANWIGEESDGVLELHSALNSGGFRIPAIESGKSVPIQVIPEIHMRLDHIKQFLDYRFFTLLGTQHLENIRDEQARIYGAIVQRALGQP